MSAKLGELFQNGLIRFIIVGVVNTVIGLTVTFLCLNAFELNYWASTIIGNAVGAVNSYFMNKSFTFKSKASVGSTVWKFMLITAVCYFAAYWLAGQAVDIGLDWILPEASSRFKDNVAALVGSGLYTLMNYFGQKKLTFTDKRQVTDKDSAAGISLSADNRDNRRGSGEPEARVTEREESGLL
ncbi:GtrA family protein [Paenibacillus yonginensis]|uniref:GtrA family protein n=1 Tax=Paenibacillus yonginensis TaxID=1462996 RepID=UPI000837E003|nr:GtrA family protein [Paenibacillus yonginensis]